VATFGADELPRIQAGLAETGRKRQELFPEIRFDGGVAASSAKWI
jgi:hypothetical protein